jgi:hypothetical protein
VQRFRTLLADKLENESFRQLFKSECHVCRTTIRVIERLCQQGLEPHAVAAELGIEPHQLQELEDADYCDPLLVRDLCVRLQIPVPDSCPRLDS